MAVFASLFVITIIITIIIIVMTVMMIIIAIMLMMMIIITLSSRSARCVSHKSCLASQLVHAQLESAGLGFVV